MNFKLNFKMKLVYSLTAVSCILYSHGLETSAEVNLETNGSVVSVSEGIVLDDIAKFENNSRYRLAELTIGSNNSVEFESVNFSKNGTSGLMNSTESEDLTDEELGHVNDGVTADFNTTNLEKLESDQKELDMLMEEVEEVLEKLTEDQYEALQNLLKKHYTHEHEARDTRLCRTC